MPVELSFDFEAEMPKSKRAGAGREGEPYEVHLDPLRQNPGKPARVFTFSDREEKDGNGKAKTITAKSQAATKVTVISTRLRKANPKEDWKFNVRDLNDNGSEVGLWITYNREMTDDEFAEYQARTAERSAKIKEGRAKRAALREEANPTQQTPAERVKAARAAAGTTA